MEGLFLLPTSALLSRQLHGGKACLWPAVAGRSQRFPPPSSLCSPGGGEVLPRQQPLLKRQPVLAQQPQDRTGPGWLEEGAWLPGCLAARKRGLRLPVLWRGQGLCCVWGGGARPLGLPGLAARDGRGQRSWTDMNGSLEGASQQNPHCVLGPPWAVWVMTHPRHLLLTGCGGGHGLCLPGRAGEPSDSPWAQGRTTSLWLRVTGVGGAAVPLALLPPLLHPKMVFTAGGPSSRRQKGKGCPVEQSSPPPPLSSQPTRVPASTENPDSGAGGGV